MADPGFPRGGGANSPGTPTYEFAKFSQKLHEIESIWTPGGRASLAPPLDPPLQCKSILTVPRKGHCTQQNYERSQKIPFQLTSTGAAIELSNHTV